MEKKYLKRAISMFYSSRGCDELAEYVTVFIQLNLLVDVPKTHIFLIIQAFTGIYSETQRIKKEMTTL